MLDGTHLVAVKNLKPELLKDPSEVDLFIKETKLMKKIRSRGIVEMLGVGGQIDPVTGGFQDLFIIQEYCAGGSLRDIVFKQMTGSGKVIYTQADALRWSLELAKALRYLHTAKPKVIHRDLKLDNILLTDIKVSNASAKLADFGLAKLMTGTKQVQLIEEEISRLNSSSEEQWTSIQRKRSVSVNSTLDMMEAALSATEAIPENMLPTIHSGKPSQDDTPSHIPQLTTTDMTCECGSYAYMAPEVLTGSTYDEKADIFSFAMIMYNTFYRIIPSVMLMAQGGVAEDIAMLAYRTAHGYRPNFSSTVPQKVNDLINACWSGTPELRPSAQEVVVMLEAIIESQVCKGSVADSSGVNAGCSCALM